MIKAEPDALKALTTIIKTWKVQFQLGEDDML